MRLGGGAGDWMGDGMRIKGEAAATSDNLLTASLSYLSSAYLTP